MGWLSFSMNRPVKDWFKEEYISKSSDVLDVAVVKRNTLYAAVRRADKPEEVFCLVMLIRWSRGWDNFCYKDMTEHCGPGVIECPEKIFKLLTPLNDENDPNGWGREWRKKVEELHKFRKNPNRYIIKLPTPLNFTSGYSYQCFIREKNKFYGLYKGLLLQPHRVSFNPLKYGEFQLIEFKDYKNDPE